MDRRKWELLSECRPKEPGEYFIGLMEYPTGTIPSRIRMHGVESLTKKDGMFIFEFDHATDEIVWWGPIIAPEIPKDAEKRLRKDQAGSFCRKYDKVCSHCGDRTGVNARSIGYRDEPADCRKCGKHNTCTVVLKV